MKKVIIVLGLIVIVLGLYVSIGHLSPELKSREQVLRKI